jgi:phosphatidate cytidylyltransferase
MLKQRILTAVIGLPLVLYALLFGHEAVRALMFMIFVGLSVYELAAMLLPRLEALMLSGSDSESDSIRIHKFDVILSICLAELMFLAFVAFDRSYALGLIIGCLLFSILVGALLAKNNDSALGHALGYLMSIVYGALPWLLIWDLGLRAEKSGYILLLLAIVWSGDTGGYFGGRFFGKHLLAPRMSPKKTWEGALAGIVFSGLAGAMANYAYQGALGSYPMIIALSLVVGFFGQLGDLVESTFKRFARVKDSGIIFPGHGGFLDRCDGLLFAAPVLWISHEFFFIVH